MHTSTRTHDIKAQAALFIPYLPCWLQPGRPPAALSLPVPQLGLQLHNAVAACHTAQRQTETNVSSPCTHMQPVCDCLSDTLICILTTNLSNQANENVYMFVAQK